MFEPITLEIFSSISALEVREDLERLEAERALAELTGVAGIESYAADLEEELGDCRALYTVLAVTEIATLRAELFGPDVG